MLSPTCEPDPDNAGGGMRVQRRKLRGLPSRVAFFVAMATWASLRLCDCSGGRGQPGRLGLREAATGRREDKMTILIFANGDVEDYGWIGPYLAEATTVIAADGGADHVLSAGARPDLIIGDLDSFPEERQEELEAQGVEFVTYPRAKDETDLELALLHAVRSSEDEDTVLVLGGLGGRLDQLFANILLLMHPELRFRAIRFLTKYQQIWLAHGETEITGKAGDTVSLIPLGGDVHMAATTGLQWELTDETLSFGPARGLSNVMTADLAKVEVRSGHLLCVHTKQGWGR